MSLDWTGAGVVPVFVLGAINAGCSGTGAAVTCSVTCSVTCFVGAAAVSL